MTPATETEALAFAIGAALCLLAVEAVWAVWVLL